MQDSDWYAGLRNRIMFTIDTMIAEPKENKSAIISLRKVAKEYINLITFLKLLEIKIDNPYKESHDLDASLNLFEREVESWTSQQ